MSRVVARVHNKSQALRDSTTMDNGQWTTANDDDERWSYGNVWCADNGREVGLPLWLSRAVESVSMVAAGCMIRQTDSPDSEEQVATVTMTISLIASA